MKFILQYNIEYIMYFWDNNIQVYLALKCQQLIIFKIVNVILKIL